MYPVVFSAAPSHAFLQAAPRQAMSVALSHSHPHLHYSAAVSPNSFGVGGGPYFGVGTGVGSHAAFGSLPMAIGYTQVPMPGCESVPPEMMATHSMLSMTATNLMTPMTPPVVAFPDDLFMGHRGFSQRAWIGAQTAATFARDDFITAGAAEIAAALDVAEPGSLLCPITQAMYRDPCFVPESGNTYERDALEQYWASTPEPRDPLTNMTLTSTVLYPNWGVRREVQRFLQEQPQYVPQGWSDRDVPRPTLVPTPMPTPVPRTEVSRPRVEIRRRYGEPLCRRIRLALLAHRQRRIGVSEINA